MFKKKFLSLAPSSQKIGMIALSLQLSLSVVASGSQAYADFGGIEGTSANDVLKAGNTESGASGFRFSQRLKGWMHRPSLVASADADASKKEVAPAGVPATTETAEVKKVETGSNETKVEAVKTESVADVKTTEVKSVDVKPEVKVEAKSEVKTETAADVKTEAKTDVKAAGAAPLTGAGTQTAVIKAEEKAQEVKAQEVKVEAKTDEKVEIKTEAKAYGKTEAATEAKVESKPEVKTEAKVEAKPETKAEVSTEVKTESSDAKVEVSKETKPETQADAKVEPAKEVSADTKPDATSTKNGPKSAELAMMTGEVSQEKQADVGPVIIDNDEAVEMQQTIEYKDLPTDEGGTKVKAGATFPVVISSQITSKSANNGDNFEARLKYDLKIGDRMIAEKGSTVIGHVNYVLKARSAMHSLVSPERWYRNSGCLGIAFDEIVNSKGEHIPLVATPARAARIVKNKAEGRELGVNHNGQVTGPWSQQLRYKAVRIGLNAAMAPAGVFSFGAMPVALGVIGAANPSFAFMKPVGQNVRHRRIKGFVWGALSGVPGSWIVEDTVVKGQEAVIKPGDEFLAEFKEEFTGEPETEASLIPGASTKVKGQVVPLKKGKKQ